ncbi:MAG: 4Fe-4S dicluster domain-containing protein [Chloroflexota bacterium]
MSLSPLASPPVSTVGAGVARAFSPLVIAVDRCKGCSLCVVACTKDSLELDPTRVNVLGYHPVRLVEGAACSSCAICARVCPDAVFTVLAPPRGTER